MTNNNNGKFITPQGLKDLKEEYDRLTKTERPRILNQVAELRALGDLSENAAYHEARKQQAFLEGRIQELETLIKEAVVVGKTRSGVAQVGSSIVVETNGKKEEFSLVGGSEADWLKGRVSIESPLGSQLIGKKQGDILEIDAPEGKIKYKVICVK